MILWLPWLLLRSRSRPSRGDTFIDLTTIRQDATQMAELAVEAATQRLDDGRTTARNIVVKPTLIVRGSTGPARPRHC